MNIIVSLALRAAWKHVSRKRLAEPVFNAASAKQAVFNSLREKSPQIITFVGKHAG
jgi:hypothetical protein